VGPVVERMKMIALLWREREREKGPVVEGLRKRVGPRSGENES